MRALATLRRRPAPVSGAPRTRGSSRPPTPPAAASPPRSSDGDRRRAESAAGRSRPRTARRARSLATARDPPARARESPPSPRGCGTSARASGVLQVETTPEQLGIAPALRADLVLLHAVERARRGHPHGLAVEIDPYRLEIRELERLAQPGEDVEMEVPFGRDVLDGGIVAQQVVRRDFLDRGIRKDRPQRRLEPLDILEHRSDEDVEILGRPGEPKKIQRDSAEYEVSDPFSLEGGQDVLGDLELHDRASSRPSNSSTAEPGTSWPTTTTLPGTLALRSTLCREAGGGSRAYRKLPVAAELSVRVPGSPGRNAPASALAPQLGAAQQLGEAGQAAQGVVEGIDPATRRSFAARSIAPMSSRAGSSRSAACAAPPAS